MYFDISYYYETISVTCFMVLIPNISPRSVQLRKYINKEHSKNKPGNAVTSIITKTKSSEHTI